jgi:C4-type Zn-finger protein
MRPAACLLVGSLVLTGSVLAKDAPLRTAEQRFSSLSAAEEPSFRRHVVPLISRAGCNGRECHGSFQGRGGFELSLFGYDFEKDLKEMTQDADGGEKQVRINREHPEKSLLLLKGTNEEPHKGKERYKKGSWEYNLMLKWIGAGAKSDVEATGEFGHLEVTPKEIVFKRAGEKVQLRVLAHWKDGTVEDVTQLTRFRSNDDSVSTISATGLVESKDKGDTHIVAFYDNGVTPIPVMLPVSDKVGPKYPPVATASKVDELVVEKLRKLGIVPSGVCTDTEFLRRVSLDLIGTLPTPDEITRFLADKSAGKRAAKVDELLKTPAYAAWWTTKLSDFLGNNARVLRGNGQNNYGERFSRQWYDWMKERVARNEPYDQMMAGIILASGRTKEGQTYEEFAKEMSGYFRAENPLNFAERPTMPYFWQRQNLQKAEEKALAFSHSFLGVRIECAQCHKHPFDQWTKDDFKSFQAFFEGVRYGSKPAGRDSNEKITYASLTKEIREAVPPDPKGGNNQKALGAEFEKRVKAGEPAPWQEVFAEVRDQRKLSDRELERMKRQNPNFDGRVLTPKILGGEEVMLKEFPDPRAPLMEWLRSPKNPYFAKAWVNRVWASYFHRGLVEPADDMNLANPPVNEALMDFLAEGFVKSGYNMAWLHKEILTSATYQRSWQPNDTNKHDEKNFSRFVLRRLPAEVVVDGITQATLSTERIGKFRDDIESRAIGPNANAGRGGKGASNYSLNIFGKPVRETNCDCERTTDPTLLQTLFTRNDPELLNALEQSKGSAWVEEVRKATTTVSAPRAKGDIAQLEGLIRKMEFKLKENPERREQIEAELKGAKEKLAKLLPSPTATKPTTANLDDFISQVFLRTVSRPPTATEIEKARADLAAANSPAEGVRELLWAMLNTREFMVNH